jgi:hypothetical protein
VAAIFQPDPLNYLFGAGIGTNIGASIFWALIAGGFGYWIRGHIRKIHQKLDQLHASHEALHAKIDALSPPAENHVRLEP